ncbi:flippase [Cycloclasticus pugetii]|uniref:Membrane protein involved in the export of O-antigen and teichoic acid n=1 Tax=Cycloclasticus pugetii TaxID=34068 RepID=A0AB33YZ71_9GAMM|nr:flippase [Cycloclasticus pugetii]EPD12213.1 hypothetical protein L196_10424 [Cycloclasticus pugetii]
MRGLGLRNLLGNSASTFLRQLLAGVLQLVVIAIIAREYGPESNGLYTMALLLPSMLGTFFNLGLSPANIYFIGAGKVGVKTAWVSVIKFFLILSIMGLCFGAAVIWWFAGSWFDGVSPLLLWFSLLLFPVSLFLSFVTSIFQGLQEFRIFNRVLLIQPSITLLVIVCLQLLENEDVLWLLVASFIGSIIALIVSILLLRPFVANSTSAEIQSDYGRALLSYGYKAHLSNTLAFINYKADIFLVNFFVGPVGAGIYVIAVQIVERLWMISQAVSTVLLPRLSELSDDEKTRKLLTPIVSRWVVFITFIGAALMAVLAFPFVILVFGNDYLGSISPMLVLLPGVVVFSSARVLANDLAARGKPELNMYASALSLVLNIITNITLIPKYGLTGAAIATSLSYVSTYVYIVFIYSRVTNVAIKEVMLVKASEMVSFRALFAAN